MAEDGKDLRTERIGIFRAEHARAHDSMEQDAGVAMCPVYWALELRNEGKRMVEGR